MASSKQGILEDQLGVSWNDPLWLRVNPLSEANVLYYFSMSKFYDIRSVTQVAITQNLPPEERRKLRGIEYELVYHTAENRLFIIVARNRKSPEEAEELAYYCVVDGLVFQCPRLRFLLRNKMDDIALGLDQLFDVLFDQFPEKYQEEIEEKYELEITDMEKKEEEENHPKEKVVQNKESEEDDFEVGDDEEGGGIHIKNFEIVKKGLNAEEEKGKEKEQPVNVKPDKPAVQFANLKEDASEVPGTEHAEIAIKDQTRNIALEIRKEAAAIESAEQEKMQQEINKAEIKEGQPEVVEERKVQVEAEKLVENSGIAPEEGEQKDVKAALVAAVQEDKGVNKPINPVEEKKESPEIPLAEESQAQVQEKDKKAQNKIEDEKEQVQDEEKKISSQIEEKKDEVQAEEKKEQTQIEEKKEQLQVEEKNLAQAELQIEEKKEIASAPLAEEKKQQVEIEEKKEVPSESPEAKNEPSQAPAAADDKGIQIIAEEQKAQDNPSGPSNNHNEVQVEVASPEGAQPTITTFANDAENGLSCERMDFVSRRNHPHAIHEGGFHRHSVCDNVGSHPCFLFCDGESSAFKKYGIGVVLYFKQLKFLAILTLIISLFAIPALILYIMSNPYDSNEITLYSINRKALAKTTFGNLGRGGYACTNGVIGETVHLKCMYGIINSLNSFGYSTESSSCSIEDADLKLDSQCNMGTMSTKNQIMDTFSHCIGQSSCTFTLEESHVSPGCLRDNQNNVIFLSAVCESTEVKFDLSIQNFSFPKSTIALVAVICDVAATLIFAIGLGLYFSFREAKNRLGYYERKEVKQLKQQTHYISDYAVEIKELYKLPFKDPVSLKEALWIHLEENLKESRGGNNWRIFDIQLALSDTGFLELLETLRKEKYALKMLEKRTKATDKETPEIQKQREKIQKAEKDMVDYKNQRQKPYVVKAFVTFTEIEAANYIEKSYNVNCCGRCCSSAYDDLYLEEQWLKVVSAPAPTDIQWRNLQIGQTERFLRSCFTVLLSIIVIAEKDYYKGKEKSLGYLPCYCASRIIDFGLDVVQETFPEKGEKLCSGWIQSYATSNGLMLGTVLFVSIANLAICYILTKITAFERNHSVTNELASGTLKIFVSQFINAAVIIFLVNLKTGIDLGKDFPILKGDYSEFTVKWYEVVGTPIILFTLVSTVSTHFMEFLKFLWTLLRRCIDRGCSTDPKRTRQVIQEDYEAVYTGPEFDLQIRYASSVHLIFLVLLYSAGMPVLYLCLPFSFMISFLIDKFLFVRFFKTPPQYGSKLAEMSQGLYKYAIIFHLGFGFWMFSNGEIVQYASDFNDSGIKENIKDYSDLPLGDRVTTPHSLVIFVAFLVVTAFYIAWYVLSTFMCWNCGSDVKKNDQNLLDQMSYEDLMNEYMQTKQELYALGKAYPKFYNKLEEKLEAIGKGLKKHFEELNDGGVTTVDPKELSNNVLKDFFYRHKEKLIKSSIQGLCSYRLMSNPQYSIFKEQWEELQRSETPH